MWRSSASVAFGHGRLGDVVRHCGPDRQGGYAGAGAGVLHDPDDARRPFVAGLLEVERARQVFVGGRPGHRHRTAVRRVGEQRAERHDHLDAEFVAVAEDLAGEGLPAHVGLDAADEHDVAAEVSEPSVGNAGGRPRDDTLAVVADGDRRPVDLVVVVVLGVQSRQRDRRPHLLEVLDRRGRGVSGVVPTLERRDQQGIDQLGHTLELDHRAIIAFHLVRARQQPVRGRLRPLGERTCSAYVLAGS